MAQNSLVIDDTNTTVLNYQGPNWIAGAWSTNSGQTGTLHTTNAINATVSFTFPGTYCAALCSVSSRTNRFDVVVASGFQFWGMKRSHGGRYGICFDCLGPQPFLTLQSIDAFDASDNGQNPPVLLFNQIFDTPAAYTVLLINMPDPQGTPANNSQLAVDRFVLLTPSPNTSTSAPTVSSTITRSETSSFTRSTPLPTTAASTTESTHSSIHSHPLPVGIIVGAVLGGLALVSVLVSLSYWFGLRSARLARSKNAEAFVPAHVPYMLTKERPTAPASKSSSRSGRVLQTHTRSYANRSPQPSLTAIAADVMDTRRSELGLRRLSRDAPPSELSGRSVLLPNYSDLYGPDRAMNGAEERPGMVNSWGEGRTKLMG